MCINPRFYLIGTKYAKSHNLDILPKLLEHGIISIGFFKDLDLNPIIGADFNQAKEWVQEKAPHRNQIAINSLARFAGIRPGDIVALKSHSAPSRHQARLVISKYAVVKGNTKSEYMRIPDLGHTMAVDFLDQREPIELPLGYGRTLHEILKIDRRIMIFGAYARYAYNEVSRNLDKDLTSVEVPARGGYLMQRIHNQIQNNLRKVLEDIYGPEVVTQEQNYVDIKVSLGSKTILFEVKSSPSPISCLREAVGQLLQYSWNLGLRDQGVSYVVVGPTEIYGSAFEFLKHIRKETGLNINYCTPASYVSDNY
tara:strand:+ start:202 stop:1134 length:933 start_codon:yes stop_codon:yes gene_type:complete